MTPEQRDELFEAVSTWVSRNASGDSASAQADAQRQVLGIFQIETANGLARRLLEEAEGSSDADEVELALDVAFLFGPDDSLVPVLRRLSRAAWHTRHQDIVHCFWEMDAGDEVVPEVEFLAWAGPEFQDYPGSTALARHAAHQLERIGSSSARAALARLRVHPEPEIRALIQRIEARLPPLDGPT